MTYACKRDATMNEAPPFSIIPHPDLCAHPCLQVLDIAHVGELWCIVNFYHNVQDNSGLTALLTLDLDPFTPTLVQGDFNSHSRSRSPDNIDPSHWSWRLKEWVVINLLSLANTPGVITHKGTNNKKDSIIDLVWFNATAINEATFSNLQVDWKGSLGSDHAALHVMARTFDPTKPPPNLKMDPGYLIEDGAKQKWIETLQHILAQ